jgi:hypothetical protein
MKTILLENRKRQNHGKKRRQKLINNNKHDQYTIHQY